MIDHKPLTPSKAKRSVRLLSTNQPTFSAMSTIDGFVVVADDTGRPVTPSLRESRARQLAKDLSEQAKFGPRHLARAIASLDVGFDPEDYDEVDDLLFEAEEVAYAETA